ncbi:type I restriction-modification system subunit M [Geobacter anodireducens]|uniref:site-specific DNA-methyltransferase (adenine-specific) n=1 Tax=Geobacter soli TaxID=1510391 RepID=A0A0C1R0C6_9BACT|nr:type I restriction-modification system subunit M [Geobacter soli]KIE43936.1 DNA methyltransferase [Geobacter soli]
MHDITQIEQRLWEAADQLRANSKLTATEYAMPILGLIFLRHAYNRFLAVREEVEATLPKRGGVPRPLAKDDFTRKSALFLREESRFDHLLNLPADRDRGQAIIDAMEAIEADYESLSGVLPKDYQIFDNDLLGRLLKIFNDGALRNASGDVFGRIYEYFLMKFAMEGAQDKGEFFTPPSLVRTIVNVIEPDHGTILDPACGSGGMFVQTGYFIEDRGRHTAEAVTFYGQEKTATTIRLAKMNLAVHGLEGDIREGNTFYEDAHELAGKCDFTMGNPPFNVDGVDAGKIKADPRLPFGLPGVNNKKEVSNGNYLWISYFYSYLSDTGRSGFVMSSQASSAGHGEKEVRRKLVETGHVDAMIAIRSNFFYTRTVPCELWFLNRAKPEHLRDKVLMIDARNIYRKVTRKIFDFSPEQLANLTAIVWLYRGQTDKYLALVGDYLAAVHRESALVRGALAAFEESLVALQGRVAAFGDTLAAAAGPADEGRGRLRDTLSELADAHAPFLADRDALHAAVAAWRKRYADIAPDNGAQLGARHAFDPIAEELRGMVKQVDHLVKLIGRAVEIADKELDARSSDAWDSRAINRLRKELDEKRREAVDQLKHAAYFHRQAAWLQGRFPEARLADVPGLVKLADRAEIAANDWSLTPGRYVGVAPPEVDEDFDFEEALREIHVELAGLNEEAAKLAEAIQCNFEGLGA